MKLVALMIVALAYQSAAHDRGDHFSERRAVV